MNLRAIANGVTRAVNPNMTATLMLNNGYRTDDTGVRTAHYDTETVTIQTQSLSSQERQEFDGLLQQGHMLNVYVTGQFSVLRRIAGKGSDKLVFAPYGETEPTEWLIKSVSESWPDWCKVVVWRQH
nr:MAG TPA: head closure knob [Caudoviricetes sp.]